VELVDAGVYRRTFAIGEACGTVEVRPPAAGKHALTAVVATSDVGVLGAVVARLRGVFDLDADAAAIDAHLARDPRLAPDVRRRPGVRVPGAWSGFELAVRAVLGQQVSVAAATTLSGRLAAAHGESLDGAGPDGPRIVFPAPAALARAELEGLGLPRARAAALRALAAEAARDASLFVSYDGVDGAVRRLCTIPGVGPWTAKYVAMRALREPDAFPESDLGLLRAMENGGGRPTDVALLRFAEAWRPWRAYAAVRLWTEAPAPAPRARSSASARARRAQPARSSSM
jgi:AraC family transcriptional regulator of adaptative response / DNA-3-methyladenine glycosylase II